jgi:hypothetical protein
MLLCSLPQRSVNVYRLKYSVLVKDADLSALRASSVWADLSASLAGGDSASAGGAASVRLRAEAKAPFRALRLFLLGGLAGGAALGGFVTVPALLKALLAMPGAAEVGPTATNMGVDVAVLAACVFFFRKELVAKAAQEALVAREEALGALRVALSADSSRAAQLASLRGGYRPLVLTGTRAALKALTKGAEPYKRELMARGVLLVLLEDEATGADAAPKPKGFGAAAAAAAAASSGAGGGAPALSDGGGGDACVEARWRAPPVDAPAWRTWAATQRASVEPPLPAGTPFYVAVALDGTVSRSGAGGPKWCAPCAAQHVCTLEALHMLADAPRASTVCCVAGMSCLLSSNLWIAPSPS